jgi:cytoskeletal protein CcmA (bactofilin family)
MKSLFASSVSLSLIAIAALNGCAGAPAAVERSSSKQVTIEQPVDNDLMAAGENVRLAGEVQGDVATAGSEVNVAGPVAGYVMAAGRNVSVSAQIENDLWAAGETVTVDGRIADMAMVAGRTVRLGREAFVGDNARLAGNTVQVDGHVERDLSIGAATAQISGEVGGNVNARARRVSILPGAVIKGDLVVHAYEPLDISPQATIGGQVRYKQLEQDVAGGWLMFCLMGFLALLILGLPLLVFFPTWPARIAATMTERFGSSMLAGLVLLVATPLAVVLLAVTIVGIPLAAVLLALYFVVLALSGVFVSYEIGAWLLTRMHRPHAAPWYRLTVGAAIVSLLLALPVVGVVLGLLVIMLGAGAFALERRWREA